jgi:hypothetical protein
VVDPCAWVLLSLNVAASLSRLRVPTYTYVAVECGGHEERLSDGEAVLQALAELADEADELVAVTTRKLVLARQLHRRVQHLGHRGTGGSGEEAIIVMSPSMRTLAHHRHPTWAPCEGEMCPSRDTKAR